ncbi:MAG: tyrosine-type recombinase/integrase [Candidatus Bathyarchaeia archaeon]
MPPILKSTSSFVGEMYDIHDYHKRVESAKRRLRSLPYSELLLNFIDHLQALGLSKGRIAKYANHLCTLFKACPFDPRHASRKSVEGVIAWIESQPYKTSTKDDLRLVVRKIVQYAKCGSCAKKTPVPPEVAWFSVRSRDDKDSRVRPESLLTIDEVKAMMAAAENERDRAMISILFEAALRPSELLSMKVGSVSFNSQYCLITAVGKTGLKRIPLVASFKPLLEWLQKHPLKGDVNAPLWVTLGNNSKNGMVSYYYLRKLIKKLAEKAGVKKDVWPYLFRHTTLTNLAKVFTESRLEHFAGWVQGSRMARRYVHFSARDIEDAVLELHGIRKKSEADGVLRAVECPRCRERNSPDSVRCSFCGYILDARLAFETEEKRVERLEDILKRLERLEQMVYSFLGGKGEPLQQQ